MSAFLDRVKGDVDSVFLGGGTFEEPITYTPVDGSGAVEIQSQVFEDAELQDGTSEMDGVYMPTLGNPARFDISQTDIAAPAYGDSILWNGKTYTVRQFTLRDGMWTVAGVYDIKGDF